MPDKHKELTEKYSTWGDKLLQHTDVLYYIQNHNTFKPVTIQLAPCEVCDSNCPFCSVANRPLKSYMPFEQIKYVLKSFRFLGAKSVEITGGGNPMLYRDRDTNENINDIIAYAKELGFKIGLITNSHNFKRLNSESIKALDWIRVSLIKLDEGKNPEDYNFYSIPANKLSFSYIIYNQTTTESINKIVELVKLNPKIKFVRLAGDCLDKEANIKVQKDWKEVVDAINFNEKFFIKDIYDNNNPYMKGCYVGLIRPYIAPNPIGGDYQVYICTSHVLNCQNYDLKYSLGSVKDIIAIWSNANHRFSMGLKPYEIDYKNCEHCYYFNNNKLLHTVATEMPDKDFP